MLKETTTYTLYSTERIYRKSTLISFYFQKNAKVIKKYSPIDINGERLRVNLETGETSCYKLKDVLASHNASLRRTVIEMNTLLSMNDFDWFLTLTFDRHKIDRTNAQAVFDCYKKWINNLKKQFPNTGYMTFPERHEDGCFHFHMLVNGITAKQLGLVDSGKVCCSWATNKNGVASKDYFNKTKYLQELKETDGEPIYNVTSFAYGYSTVSRIVSRERCNSYVKKYVEKALGSTDVFKKRFYYSDNLKRPDIIKRVIGSDYLLSKNLLELDVINENKLVKYSDSQPYLSEYNVLQVNISNETKNVVLNGFKPVSIKPVFNGKQEKMNL